MEDIMKPDIDNYFEGWLGTNIGIEELRRLEPQNISKSMKEIRDRPEGYFYGYFSSPNNC